jgi:hypothetical protein
LRLVVLSTGWKHANAHICRASVARQLGAEVEHRYIEASEQYPPKTKIENLLDMVADLDPRQPVALLDGDDWLAHRHVAKRVLAEHHAGAWVTYGSFVQSDGTRGFAAPYGPQEDYRTTPWRATHLKTMRAGLLQRVRREDLMLPAHLYPKGAQAHPKTFRDGLLDVPSPVFIDRGDDPAFMLPILEMAGRDRVRFLPDVLYVYDYAQSWERTIATKEEKARELAIVAHVRSLPTYQRIEALT